MIKYIDNTYCAVIPGNDFTVSRHIKTKVEEFYKLDFCKRGGGRTNVSIAIARKAYWYLCRKYTALTLTDLADNTGVQHHAVLHGLKILRRGTEAVIVDQIEQIERSL